MSLRLSKFRSALQRIFTKYIDPLALTVSVCVLVLSAAAGFIIYQQSIKELEGIVRTRLAQVAELAASMTDADTHNSFISPAQKNSDAYRRIQASYLQILRANNDLIYIYSVVPCGKKLCLVMDASLPRPDEAVIPSEVMQVYATPSPVLRQALLTRTAAVETDTYTDEYGTFLSAYAPIQTSRGARGGIVGVDMSYKQFQSKVYRIKAVVIIGLCIATLFSITIGVLITLLRRKNVRLQRKYKSILSNITNVVFEARMDDELTITFVNEYITHLTGYPAGDFIEGRVRNFESLMLEEERTYVMKGIRNQLDQAGRFDVECRLIPKLRDEHADRDAKPIWVRISGVRKMDADVGRIVVEGYMQNITLRKATEAKVAESEKTFRQLADSMPNLLWITNVYGDTVFYNQTWLDYTGRSMNEEIDDGWTANIHPEDRDACLEKFIDALAKEEAFQCWFRLKGRDGAYRWMLSNCTPKFTSRGKCDGYISAATDITERKAFEAKLKRTNQHLEIFFKLTPAAIAVFDVNMNYLMVSEQWKLDYDLQDRDVVGLCHYDVMPELSSRWKTGYERCLTGEIITDPGDFVTVRKGREEWISYAFHPWSEDGVVMGVIAFTEIITERKKFDEELRVYRNDLEIIVEKQTQAIRRESDKNILLRNIITSANAASDLTAALRGCLDEICNFTGWPSGLCYFVDENGTYLQPSVWSTKAQDLHPALVAHINAESVATNATGGALLRSFHSGEPQWEDFDAVNGRDVCRKFGYQGSVCVPIKIDGHQLGVFEFLIPCSPDPDIELSHLLGNVGLQFGQLVERLRQQERLRLAKENAEDLARAKSEFLSNMSHELRTPMHAILNYAGMSAKRLSAFAPDSEITVKLDKYLTNITTAGTRLMGLLNNLLDLAKMESGKMTYHIQINDLRKTIEQTTMELDSLLKAKALEVTLDCSVADTCTSYDHAKMMQVLVNLFSNAIKFSPEGGKLKLRLYEAVGGGITCALADEGLGIPEAELSHIFEAFIQSSDTKSGAGGTGLGLSICKQIITAHGGEIWARNNPGGGACFTFTLPKSEAAAKAFNERLAG